MTLYLKKIIKVIMKNSIKINPFKFMLALFKKEVIDIQKNNKFKEQKDLISAIDVSYEDLQKNFSIINNESNIRAELKTINWFIPNFEHPLYGGIYTILRFAAYFQKNNLNNRIIIYDNPGVDVIKLKLAVIKEFPSLAKADFVIYDGNLENLPESDASISTFWTSCYLNLKFNKTKKKFYFIQDYEPLFYSANSYYALAEATYRFGFRGIVNTPGLADFVKNQHGMECLSFYPCVDRRIYNISDHEIKNKLRKDSINIFFYGRPNHDRNAFELAVISLIKLKEKYGDKINIYSAGDDWKEERYGVAGIIKNLGRLDSLEKVANLYKECDIGLVFMFTKHPSYQPFEYMACGCAVVTNYNESNLWFLKDKENCLLSFPSPGCIVEKISVLVDNQKIRESLVWNGIESINRYTWDEECKKVLNYIK